MMSACGSNKLTSFLAGRHRLALEYPALALVNDARDQRQIMIDTGAPPLGRHPDGLGQPFGDGLQLRPSGRTAAISSR
jgi:hypothetical protein